MYPYGTYPEYSGKKSIQKGAVEGMNAGAIMAAIMAIANLLGIELDSGMVASVIAGVTAGVGILKTLRNWWKHSGAVWFNSLGLFSIALIACLILAGCNTFNQSQALIRVKETYYPPTVMEDAGIDYTELDEGQILALNSFIKDFEVEIRPSGEAESQQDIVLKGDGWEYKIVQDSTVTSPQSQLVAAGTADLLSSLPNLVEALAPLLAPSVPGDTGSPSLLEMIIKTLIDARINNGGTQ